MSNAKQFDLLNPARLDSVLLRNGLGFIWLATGLGFLHPYYRQIGAEYLDRVGLPVWLMGATCAAEVVLGLRVALGPASSWLALLQAALIVGFTLILGAAEPALLVHPLGILTKNVPLLAIIGVTWLLEREGWSPRAWWLLRLGMATVWLTEGLLPNILFQTDYQRELMEATGLPWGDPSTALRVAGSMQILSAAAALLLRGRVLAGLLACQALGLVGVCVLVTWGEPLLWLHPFGPLTKNLPIFVGHLVLLRHALIPPVAGNAAGPTC